MRLVTREVQHRIADHGIGKAICKRHVLDRSDREVRRRKPGRKLVGQGAHMLDCLGVGIDPEHLGTGTQQPHQIASVATARVDDPHAPVQVSAQNLVEHVNVDLAELLGNAHGRHR